MKIIETIRKYPLFSKSYNILRSFMWVIESKYYQMKTPSQREDLVARQYKKVSNENLDWTNLQTYNEKMQWAKLYEDISTKTKLADKYLVRDWVAEKIVQEYLIPVLGVWESFQEIDFNDLPKSLVLKANHAAGTNIIVSDKANLNVKYAEFLFNNWLKVNYAYFSLFQMQYEKIKPKIIAEEFIQDSK